MAKFPYVIENLINQFSQLPGVGRKTAERYVFYLLKQPKIVMKKLSQDLDALQANINFCHQCGNFSENSSLCNICSDTKRDQNSLCVVEEIHDLNVIESTNQFNGLYHVLGGTINPMEGITGEKLNVKTLLQRVKNNNVKEMIFAFNPDMTGEATIIYLKKLLQPYKIKTTRLARGLPMGSDLEYADEVTLSSALNNRKEL